MDSSDSCGLSGEPSAIQRLTPEQKDRLTEILDRYLSPLESGVPQPREELLAAHPDLAGPLATYLESLDDLHDVAAGFAPMSAGRAADGRAPAGERSGWAISACCARSAAGAWAWSTRRSRSRWAGAWP